MLKEVITVDLSFHEHHEKFGRLLFGILYGKFLDNVLRQELKEYYGFPHNGGQHTLRVTLEPADLDAFLECILEAAWKEQFGAREIYVPRATEFVRIIREERIPKARPRFDYFPAP